VSTSVGVCMQSNECFLVVVVVVKSLYFVNMFSFEQYKKKTFIHG
jgi:hypothetical protein